MFHVTVSVLPNSGVGPVVFLLCVLFQNAVFYAFQGFWGVRASQFFSAAQLRRAANLWQFRQEFQTTFTNRRLNRRLPVINVLALWFRLNYCLKLLNSFKTRRHGVCKLYKIGNLGVNYFFNRKVNIINKCINTKDLP